MKKAILLFSILFFLTTCGGDNNFEIPQNPTAALLIFPYESSLCTEGTELTPTESTILFEWENDIYTDQYELKLKNLLSGELSSFKTTSSAISITLNRATPYEWYVISTSQEVPVIAQSDSWKFYNVGVATTSYVPFPAEILSPTMSQSITTTSNTIDLNWEGTDVDDDIIGYDVYFGTTANPGIIESDIDESFLNNVPISSNTIYYWKIITKDSHGNKSDSGVHQFKIL